VRRDCNSVGVDAIMRAPISARATASRNRPVLGPVITGTE